jgi:dTDP-glucose 4,6-dehydratase
MSRILVTGSLGTLGRPLVSLLRSRGHSVLGCDLAHHASERAPIVGIDEGDYVRCDVADYSHLLRTLVEWQPDYVFHAAAEFGRWNGEVNYASLWRTNVTGTKNLLTLQSLNRFRMVFFSSSEVYGDWDGVMREDVTDTEPIRLLNDYAMSKAVNEQQIRNSAAQHCTETVIVRLFNTYGPGEYYTPYRSVNCRMLYRALHGQPFTVFKGHSRTSMWIDDAVVTIANVADNFKAGETYNIGGDELDTIETMAHMTCHTADAPLSLVRYRDPEPMTTKTKVPDCSKAKRDLGHENTINLADGLSRTADWMREVYKNTVT